MPVTNAALVRPMDRPHELAVHIDAPQFLNVIQQLFHFLSPASSTRESFVDWLMVFGFEVSPGAVTPRLGSFC
jgi:hypothetical protein